ncbi:MAG: helix-turn-helix transcriptional regulator [Candidatus Lokiarchaeota archaeon]|nr:helix-turn-helix transcriptional regulator [Candidatus Lokiarchaeota archaeon]
MEENEGKIKSVLKALGHYVRRDIIRVIEENNGPVSYSRLLKTLELPASSNIAYHIKILVDANLVEKTNEGDYYLTKEGKKSMILFSETKNSFILKVSEIGHNFSRLSPIIIFLTAWSYFLFTLGLIMMLQYILLIGIILTIFWVLTIVLVSYRTKSIFSYIFIQMFIWIFFLKKKINKILVFLISILGYVSVIIIFGTLQVAGKNVSSPVKELIGLMFLLITIICSIVYLSLSYKK